MRALALCTLLLIVSPCGALQAERSTPLASGATATTTINPNVPGAGSYVLPVIFMSPDATVLDLDAMPHPLARYTHGKITVLSFIYTYCSDARGCPLVMTTMLELRRRLLSSGDMAGQVRFVSISFDFGHDTPDALRRYAGPLADSLQPLRWFFLTTNSQTQLHNILDAYGQGVRPRRDAGGQPGRFFEHVVKVFLIDRAGRVREIYSTMYLQPKIIYIDIQTLLME